MTIPLIHIQENRKLPSNHDRKVGVEKCGVHFCSGWVLILALANLLVANYWLSGGEGGILRRVDSKGP